MLPFLNEVTWSEGRWAKDITIDIYVRFYFRQLGEDVQLIALERFGPYGAQRLKIAHLNTNQVYGVTLTPWDLRLLFLP